MNFSLKHCVETQPKLNLLGWTRAFSLARIKALFSPRQKEEMVEDDSRQSYRKKDEDRVRNEVRGVKRPGIQERGPQAPVSDNLCLHHLL